MKSKSFCSGILRRKNLFAVLASTLSLAVFPASGAEVTLEWDPSTDPVSGYKVYHGTISGIYTDSTNAGPATSMTVAGLTEGTTYYFVATATGTNLLESEFSNEITYTVPLPANQPPTITSISDQNIDEDASAGPINVTVDDPESSASTLTLVGTSDNPALIPDGNIVFGGSGSARTITVTPLADASGTALINITVSDGELSTNEQFSITVNSVNDAPTLTTISGQTISEDGTASVLSYSTPFSVVPVPAAAWLFGSALGLLGWIRRKAS